MRVVRAFIASMISVLIGICMLAAISRSETCDAAGGTPCAADDHPESVRHVKPKTVPHGMLSGVDHIPPTPSNVLPGIVSELTKGFDFTGGDPYNLVHKQIFVWSYDPNNKINYNGKIFLIPDQVSIQIKNVCKIKEIQTTQMSTSFTEHMNSQGESWSGGFDQHVDVGFEAKGVSMGTSYQNTMMFGESSFSQEYESQFHQKRTMSMATNAYAEAYNAQLYFDKVEESWFHPWFKLAAKIFGENPTKQAAHDFFDDYGTHIIQEAELGGTANRNIYFEETIDKYSAQKYFEEQSQTSVGWLFFSGSASDSETSNTTSTSGKTGSVFKSGTIIIGGDPSADTPEEFCASLQHHQTPRITTFKKLIPIWDFIEKITGVPEGTGELMKSHAVKMFEEGDTCMMELCQGQASMCTWRTKTRTWGLPCRPLSKDTRVIQRKMPTVLKKVVGAEAGVYSKCKKLTHWGHTCVIVDDMEACKEHCMLRRTTTVEVDNWTGDDEHEWNLAWGKCDTVTFCQKGDSCSRQGSASIRQCCTKECGNDDMQLSEEGHGWTIFHLYHQDYEVQDNHTCKHMAFPGSTDNGIYCSSTGKCPPQWVESKEVEFAAVRAACDAMPECKGIYDYSDDGHGLRLCSTATLSGMNGSKVWLKPDAYEHAAGPAYSVDFFEFARTDFVKAKFAGWTVFQGRDKTEDGQFVDHYEVDFEANYFVWEDGVFGRQKIRPTWFYDKVVFTLNLEPHTKASLCYLRPGDACAGQPYVNNNDASATFEVKTDAVNNQSKFWIDITISSTESSFKSEL